MYQSVMIGSQKKPDISYVYFLVIEDESVLKIGKADDVEKRIKDLNLKCSVDRELSTTFMMPSKEALVFERVLHLMFDDHRCVDNTHVPKNGRTEWFDDDCYEKLCEIARTIAMLKGYMEVTLEGDDWPVGLRTITKPLVNYGDSTLDLLPDDLQGVYSWYKKYLH